MLPKGVTQNCKSKLRYNTKIMKIGTNYTVEFKMKVVLEILTEKETVNRIATKYDVSPVVLSRWKNEFQRMKQVVRRFNKDQVKAFVKDNNLKTLEDVQSALKELFAETLQSMLEAELDTELGYEKHDVKNKTTRNSRNGTIKKTVISKYGEVHINVPRDRNGELDPVIVKKHQKSVTGIEDQIIAMYAKGISTWDIQDHLQNLYGVDVSPTMISNVTNKILPIIKERQNRPLQRVYDLPRPNRLASAIKESSPLRGR